LPPFMQTKPSKTTIIVALGLSIALPLIAHTALTVDPNGFNHRQAAISTKYRPNLDSAGDLTRTLTGTGNIFRVGCKEAPGDIAPSTNPQQTGFASKADLEIVAHTFSANAQQPAPSSTNPQQTGFMTAQDLATVARTLSANPRDTAPSTNPQQTGFVSTRDLRTVAQTFSASAQPDIAPSTNPMQTGFTNAQDLAEIAAALN
jgi:hypothetical protein